MNTGEDQPPLLEIRNLVIQFPNQPNQQCVVDGLSFAILPNCFSALVGESGSGKSLTALSILSLHPESAKTRGQILFSHSGIQRDLLTAPPHVLEQIRGNRISMIFQEPMTSLNPIMKCGKQVSEVFIQHKLADALSAKEKTIQLFKEVELPEPEKIFNRYPHELSGGQRQRVMIAMAIAASPVLLIADEPTTALDVRVQAGIVELIKQLQQKHGMSVLFITHDLGLVADMADEVMVMRKGEIVETGPAQRVLLNPTAAYTKALLSCRPAANLPQTRLPEIGAEKNQVFHTPYPPAKQDINTNSAPLLKVHNLGVEVKDSHTHLKKRILCPVSFEIQEGETLGLVGESGCGKTTLGKAIIGLLPKSEGSILFSGQNLDELTATDKRKLTAKIQMVFQDPFGSLDPRITIGNAILEPLVVHQIGGTEARRKEIVQDMLRKVKLSSDHFNRYPHEFSGGQRQRICIARALVLQPRLLLFDESVSALDVSVQASILNLVAELRGQLGFSALFISHDLSVIHHICNRIMVMQNGLVTESGTASEVFAHPRKPYTQKLIAAIPGKSLKK